MTAAAMRTASDLAPTKSKTNMNIDTGMDTDTDTGMDTDTDTRMDSTHGRDH